MKCKCEKNLQESRINPIAQLSKHYCRRSKHEAGQSMSATSNVFFHQLFFSFISFHFTSSQPIRPKEASDSDFTIEDVILWRGMRFLRSQCKRCSAGSLQHKLINFTTSLVKYAYKVCALGFYWPNYACINLDDVWTVNLLVHGTRLD